MSLGFKFESGQTVATPDLLDFLSPVEYLGILRRHLMGDWGDLCAEDRRLNEAALKDGSRIFSCYKYTQAKHGKEGNVYIITEAVGDNGKRASTCLMMAENY